MTVNECHRVRVTSSTSSAVNSSEGLLKENKDSCNPWRIKSYNIKSQNPCPKKRLQIVLWNLLCKDRFIVTQNILEKSL